MTERNEQIGRVYESLEGMEKPPQKLLNEVSARKKVKPPVEAGEYADFRYQAITDAKMCALMPEILEAMTKVKFVSLLLSDSDRKKLQEANDAIRVEVAKLIEKHEIPYILLDNVAKEIGGGLQQVVAGAVQTLNNRTGDCFMHLARREFGADDVHMGHVAKYIEKVYADAKKAG